ncbi:hypothetical protein CVT26_004524, partial [Gymnopilus dilepis]
MPSKFTWRRTKDNEIRPSSLREPGSLYENVDELSRRQRQLETPIYAPGGVFYQVPPPPGPHVAGLQANEMREDNQGSADAAMSDTAAHEFEEIPDTSDGIARTQIKRVQQSQRWNSIIPEMLAPYVSLLRETNSLRDMSPARERKLCNGCTDHTISEVLCVYFDRIEKIKLCGCKELALQLLSKGLFPCAPFRPSLAVDLNMLEFARGLFQNLAPNTTAWAETLEEFLDNRGFKLKTKDTLRIRFGNALQWYATLQDTKNLKLAEVLNGIRQSAYEGRYLDKHSGALKAMQGIDPADDEGSRGGVGCSSSSPGSDDGHSDPGSGHGHNDPGSGDDYERPSEYLRQRCLLCFGGKSWHQPDELFDGIVCIDANFTQKRRKSQSNAPPVPHEHPETLFVPPEEVSAMQAEVETVRPAKAKQTADDPYEPGMKVPSATLDECHESFTAADSNRIKASTQFFADTGLMALLCRHDRVLWLVNMTSPGEKQYYALCLLQKLFQHIPRKMRIGALYDIGCQLHRSCVKYGFLEEVLDRITFGISVFHAYGHQWPCQVIYHPRKCLGFGLSDGEGCERFWSAIKSLIP